MKQHGIVNEALKDVQPARSGLRRGEGFHFVLVFVGQTVEVVIRTADGLAGFAAHPVVKVELAWRVNRILDDDGHGLSDTGGTSMAFFSVHRRCAENKR